MSNVMDKPDILRLNKKLVVVSNREPYAIIMDSATHRPKIQKTTGGLVSALDPVLKETNGLWICSGGTSAGKPAQSDSHSFPYDISNVALSEKEIHHYYNGYANRQLWPLFHYFVNRCHFNNLDWEHYYNANLKFANATLEKTTADDMIWVQDYHLLLVPGMIRNLSPNKNIGFFCHIPFPSYQIFRILPQRIQLLEGMLGSDLIGFHTPSYVGSFLRCVKRLLPNSAQVNFETSTILYQGRQIQVKAFPIGIDFDQVDALASTSRNQSKVNKLRAGFNADIIGVGVDRLDYTKGILERLDAISHLFEAYPHYRKRLSFIQIAVPSRTKVREYQEMKESIEQTVGQINGRFSDGSWTPIQYIYRGFPMNQLVTYYSCADFALVTPLRDGMNLVAKEYCAANPNNTGALILSEFAGASHELAQAYQVNPYDKTEVAHTIVKALEDSPEQRELRMKTLRRTVQEANIHHWLAQFMQQFALAIEERHP